MSVLKDGQVSSQHRILSKIGHAYGPYVRDRESDFHRIFLNWPHIEAEGRSSEWKVFCRKEEGGRLRRRVSAKVAKQMSLGNQNLD